MPTDTKDNESLAMLDSLLQGDLDCLNSLMPGGVGELKRLPQGDLRRLRDRWVFILSIRNGMQAAPILIRHVKNQDRDMRKLVLFILGELGKKSKTNRLANKLLNRNINARRKAADELRNGLASGKYDRNIVVVSLVFCTYGDDEHLSDNIADLICQIKDDRTIEVLESIVERYDSMTLLPVAKAIKRIDTTKFTRLLFNEPSDEKRNVMLRSITSMPEKRLYAVVSEVLCGEKARNRAKALSLLPYFNKKITTKIFLEALGNKNRHIKARAAVALSYGDRNAIAPLIEALKDPNSSVRANATFALGRISPKNEAAMEAVRGLLEDKSCRVRKMARRVLVKNFYPRAAGKNPGIRA